MNILEHIIILPGACALESLDEEIIRIIIEEGYATEVNYPFLIKPNFSTLGSIIEITSGYQIDFTQNHTIRDLLGFNSVKLYEEYNLSDKSFDIISFDNIFIECDIARGMIFNGKRSSIIHNFTMDVDPGYKFIEKFQGGIQWYMMQNKDLISNISFKLRNENGEIVSFNGQSITFRLSIKEV